jgi:hypothetical protein
MKPARGAAFSNRLTTIRLSLLGALSIAQCIFGEEPQFEKKWTFHGKEGEVGISVTRYVRDQEAPATSMGLWGDHRTEQEEAGFISNVLDQLPGEGVKPESIGWIELRLQEPEAIRRVATCVAALPRWRAEARTGAASRFYPLVESCIAQSDAYRELSAVFQKRGLRLIPAGVEKVLLEPFNRSGADCPAHVDCAYLRVPGDALVQLNIATIESR